jgi:6-phosphogluconate dehydrogenase
MTQPLADIGLIGLAVMGENFALNMESKGFRVAVYNRTVEARRAVSCWPRSRQELRRCTHARGAASQRCSGRARS